MYGSINKQYLTHKLFEETDGALEVYTKPDFDWSNETATFYIKCSVGFNQLSKLLNALLDIWGLKNCKLYTTTQFDSLLLTDRRLIYSGGRWYD